LPDAAAAAVTERVKIEPPREKAKTKLKKRAIEKSPQNPSVILKRCGKLSFSAFFQNFSYFAK